MHQAGRNTSAIEILARFSGHESTVAAVADYMRRLGLTPDDVLAAYEEWMADLRATMVPAGRGARKRNSTLHSPLSTLKKRHKAGDFAVLPAACPACGGDVEMYQLCPQASPIWRTQAACMADACAWHGKSRLPIDALLARGTLKDSVES